MITDKGLCYFHVKNLVLKIKPLLHSYKRGKLWFIHITLWVLFDEPTCLDESSIFNAEEITKEAAEEEIDLTEYVVLLKQSYRGIDTQAFHSKFM